MKPLAVAIGGGAGALTRYWVEGLVAPRARSIFPLSTLVVNVSGSALFGVLSGLVSAHHLWAGLLPWLGTGLCGGYTTFSTFTYETLRLVEDGAWLQAALNVALSGPLSFGAAALGFLLLR